MQAIYLSRGWFRERCQELLEVFIIADGHAGRGLNGLAGNELRRVMFELIDAVDKSGAVDCLSGVLERERRSELLQYILNV
jgi:hypothetical protein